VLELQDNSTACCDEVTPVPERATVAGEFCALLTIVRLPVKFPVVKGVNVVPTVVDCPAPTVRPDALPLAVNPGPETETPEIVTLELPVLVNVTVFSALLASPIVPNLKLLTLATSGEGDAATVVGDDDSVTLQMLSDPGELITPTLLSVETERCSERNAKFDPKVICRKSNTTYAL
jgi:hypothetical protein